MKRENEKYNKIESKQHYDGYGYGYMKEGKIKDENIL